MQQTRKTLLSATFLLLVPILAIGGTTTANAAPPWKGLSVEEAPKGSPLQACVTAAQKRKPTSWTCMGGDLTATEVSDSGAVTTETVSVVEAPIVDTTNDTMFGIQAVGDDYDTWCESGTTCTRLINSYTSEVKGNLAYGNTSGVIGSFDQVLRQSFNGGNPQWRANLNWDSGPAVDGRSWVIQCRKSDALSDSNCGNANTWDPPTISSGTQAAWFPSRTVYRVNSTTLSGSTNKYHDDYYGAFTASGYSGTFSSGVLHTGRWNRCGACQYYQVPWTTSP